MSKIVSMSSGAIDPIAVTKRVFWRPVTTGTALRVGDPVCYKLDAVDHKERTVDPTHLGLTIDTYAEGSQEMTGRLFSVEEVLVDNIDVFAGIVKCLGPKAGSDGDLIEIFCANSGAVVPARVVLTATVAGRTILAINTGTRTLGNPTSDVDDFGRDTIGTAPSRPVGIAMETIAAAGMCWVKLDSDIFTCQGANDNQELQVAAGTVNVAVNKSLIDFKNTDGHSCAWLWRTRLSGAGSGAQLGVYRFDVMMDAATYGEYVDAMHVNLEVACTASQTTPVVVRGLGVMVRTQLDPDMSGTAVNVLCLDYHLRKNAAIEALTNPPVYGSYIRFNCSGSAPDYLFQAANPAAACFTANVTHAEDAKIGAIKVNIVGYGDCYLWVYDGAA